MRKAIKITLVVLISLAVVVAGLFIFIESDTFKVMLFDLAAEKFVPPEGIIVREPVTEKEDTETGQAAQEDEAEEKTDTQTEKPASKEPDLSKFTLVTKMASPEDKAIVVGILLGLLTPEEKVRYAKYTASGMTTAQQNEISGILYSRISDEEYQTLLNLYNKYVQQLN